MRKISLVLGCALACLAPLEGAATTWNVPSGVATIQAAIDSAAAGDTVLVACGTYTWSVEGSGDADGLIHMKSGVCLRSATGLSDCVTIDAESQGRVLYCANLDSTTKIEGFTLTGGRLVSSGGGVYCDSCFAAFTNCDVVANDADSTGGGMACWASSPTVMQCVFSQNEADAVMPEVPAFGGGVFCGEQSSPTLTACVIRDNEVYGGEFSLAAGGGIYCMDSSSPTLEYCTVSKNWLWGDSMGGSEQGAGLYCGSSSACVVQNCTIIGNICAGMGSAGAGMYCQDASPQLSNTIIADGEGGEAVACGGTSSPVLECCDVHGNNFGDWVGCIAGQNGVDGNFSLDPMFCNAAGGDYHLAGDSPCANAEGCGLIGALGVGCGFGIVSVADVGNDQGRQVRLEWARSAFDAPGDTVDITGYDVYRRQDGNRAAAAAPHVRIPPSLEEHGRLLVTGWDYLGSVPAHGDSTYQMVVPTLCDSTATGGICWSVFFVRATTPDPFTFIDSVPDSGYSVDNLAPAVPTGLMLATTTLAWDECPDVDFDYFTIWGSETGDLVDAVVIGYTVATSLDVGGDPHAWFHVTATDFAGNRGEDAAIENTALAVGEVRSAPSSFGLCAARPNPFAGSTTIAFDLRRAGKTTLGVYDVRGRLVRTLLDRTVPPGRHSLVWDGRDASERIVSPGIYLVRLVSGEFTATRKLVRLQ